MKTLVHDAHGFPRLQGHSKSDLQVVVAVFSDLLLKLPDIGEEPDKTAIPAERRVMRQYKDLLRYGEHGESEPLGGESKAPPLIAVNEAVCDPGAPASATSGFFRNNLLPYRGG